jgi:signal transduction histidine kinase
VAQICWWIFQIILLSRQLDGTGGMVQAKVRMLAGEFAVFFAILCGGVFYITRVFKRELRLSQNKKNFSLSITHELKTPITTTKLLVETLQNHTLPEDKKQQIYTSINEEQTRLHQLIDKVLLSERLGSEGFKLSPQKVNLSEFIQGSIDRLQVNQSVECNIQKDLHANIDEFYFSSVVSNLLENASKYSESNTKIKVSLFEKGEDVCLSFEDQGIGIPDAEKQKVFEVYYRLENEEVRNTKGTGLGLYLVQKILKLHNGTISIVNPESGKGSCFEIKLPKTK